MRITQYAMLVKIDAHNYSGTGNTTLSTTLLVIEVILKSLIACQNRLE